VNRLAARFGVDSRVFSGLAARGLPLLMAPLSSIIIALNLNVETQGLLYLFTSLLAMRSLFELGVGMSITQIAAHEPSQSSGQLSPSLVLVVERWMQIVAFCYGIFAGVGGVSFLIYQGYHDFYTLTAWVAFQISGALQFSTDGRWSLLQGADRIVEANQYRIKASIVRYVVLWALLFAGASIYSFVIADLVTLVFQQVSLYRRQRWLFP
jgi:hypothetical protein